MTTVRDPNATRAVLVPGVQRVVVASTLALVAAVGCSPSGEPEIARPIIATTTVVASSPVAAGSEPDAAPGEDVVDDSSGTSSDDVATQGTTEDDASAETGSSEGTSDGGDADAGTDTDAETSGDSGASSEDTTDDGSGDPDADAGNDGDDGDEAADPSESTGDGGDGGDGGGSSGSGGSAGGGGGSSGGSRTFSGDALVGDASPPPGECSATADECIPATCFAAEPDVCGGDIPDSVVSMGEYQSGIAVPVGARVDVYFDQSRTKSDMERRCENGHGYLTRRAEDGSRWAGWWYCQIYPIAASTP